MSMPIAPGPARQIVDTIAAASAIALLVAVLGAAIAAAAASSRDSGHACHAGRNGRIICLSR